MTTKAIRTIVIYIINTSHVLSVAAELAQSTADAYSFPYYGKRNWTRCCAMLLADGYHPIEADAILRSKITRLAADDRANADAKATAIDLQDFLASWDDDEKREWIDECIVNINFAEPEPVKLNSREALRLVWSR